MVSVTKDNVVEWHRRVCANLKSAKEAKNLSFEEIAEKTNLHKGSVCEVFNYRKTNPRAETVQLICKALGLTLSEAFGGPRRPGTWKSIIQRVRRHVRESGDSYRDFGNRADMERTSVWRIVNDKGRSPKLRTLYRLADGCGCEPHELLSSD